MAGALAEHGKIKLGQRTRGQYLHLGAGSQPLQGLAHSPDRLRANQASTVDDFKARIMITHV